MQNATKLNYAQRMPAFTKRPVTATPARMLEVRRRFEQMLIFVLCTLWAVGVVLWTLFSMVGFGHGSPTSTAAFDPASMATSLPSLQSAAVVAARLMLGW